MSVQTASDDQAGGYPRTKFAAVDRVQYADTDDQNPLAKFRSGGVMLSEVLPGESRPLTFVQIVVIIVTGSTYSFTVATMMVSANWEILQDNVDQVVRWAPRASRDKDRRWTYVRFFDRVVYADFNRRLWEAFHQLTVKQALIRARVDEIAHSEPSNFTKYCRQYLGEGYFDTLVDMDEEDASDGDQNTVG
ncbi:hypothetical protein L226DRAFT_527746 [Lentinus tigrinus ALCF2SS1-7]|uniref:Uncharacterized protein n=1 Tax=Lentinus tigrinus ALCF2SS1-6 TaxID=1328759 RepID=A0A5C2RPE6_9APHY|nr:hypothetical protein L227DRAFT_568829 [Lentinus tigrinus ALCF2SS1-6]RPD67625.1 hypothetical protein L226DRAFT_527746 [Lentinus tigrinus ALCF2SS1-7]